MMKIFIPFKLTRAYPEESNPVSMLRVQVGMYLKNKATHFIFFHIHGANRGFPAAGCRCYADKRIQHFLYPKIVDRTAKKHRRHFTIQVVLNFQFTMHPIHQFHIFPQLGSISVAQFLHSPLHHSGQKRLSHFHPQLWYRR